MPEPWQGQLNQLDAYRWEIPKTHKVGMRVPGQVFASEAMLRDMTGDQALEQVANVATLPGIVGKSYAMPDIHWGYGFPIGGVAAFDADEGGVISPGGVGFDINCGVRLIRTDLTEEEVRPRIRDLLNVLFDNVPSGVGSKARVRLSRAELDSVFTEGMKWAIDAGYGWDDDLAHVEHNGFIDGADPGRVSQKAYTRGMGQVGSLGGGNHFLEIQKVGEIFDPDTAKRFGLTDPGQICIMLHCGSRGAGHQICTDHLEAMDQAGASNGLNLADPQLACAPWSSRQAEDYYAAMCCGIHYAWTNRQMITHWVREGFHQIFHRDPEDMGMRVVYDVSHNIAKMEEHQVEGRRRNLLVHRKGATRAYGPGHRDIPQEYRDFGQPVLVPGDMGTASYVLAGTEQAMQETFGSTCHGAGRVLSRTKARHSWTGREVIRSLAERGITVKAASERVAAEEAPEAYKNVTDVVGTCHGAGISRMVARMEPIGVVKG